MSVDNGPLVKDPAHALVYNVCVRVYMGTGNKLNVKKILSYMFCTYIIIKCVCVCVYII